MSFGTTLWTSPTIPRSATEKIGASWSLLMATMFLESFMPDQVLGGTRDPARQVHRRLHRLAGLADLVRVGHPAGVDDGPAGARPPVQQLGQLLDDGVLLLLAEPPPARDHHAASSSFGPVRSSTCRATILAVLVAPSSPAGAATTAAGAPARRLGGEGLGPDHEEVRGPRR